MLEVSRTGRRSLSRRSTSMRAAISDALEEAFEALLVAWLSV